jgi:tetratricopeptide (TPR) repeat protein
MLTSSLRVLITWGHISGFPAIRGAAVALLAIGIALPAGAADPARLGHLEFPTSGAAAAQAPFMEGILLLHSFEYEDAREAFRKAREIDPGFVMAAWGEAMTFNHPIWREVDLEAGRAALRTFAPTPEERQAKASTQREKDFLAAVEILYGEGTKLERDIAYSEAMGRMAARYPDDMEPRAFHALSILGTAQGVRDHRTYMKAAAVAEEVYRVNPEHPGALHYLIHSYDDPEHAVLGLRAARVYARVAPAASHAQHMISHIYVALGYWDETVDANEKSFRVSEERAQRKGLPLHSRSHHALHWLQYAYLQEGRYEDAWKLMEIMDADAAASGKSGDLWYHAMMRAGWLVETRRFDRVPGAMATVGVSIAGAAAGEFATGLVALEKGDTAAARSAHAALLTRLGAGAVAGDEHAQCATPMNAPTDTQAAEVMGKELEGLIAWQDGEREKAVALMTQATELEDAMPFEFGPPVVVKPSHEMLGEMLLETDRPAEALAAFDESLARAPRRSLSLLGKARAAGRLDMPMLAMETWDTLGKIWQKADADLPEFQDLRRRIDEARRAASPALPGSGL